MAASAVQSQSGKVAPYGALPVPMVTPQLIKLIRTGVVYSLAVIHHEEIPVPGPMVPYTLTPRLRHGDLSEISPASAAAEAITMSAHTGTHIDALCHIGEHQDAQGNPAPDGEVRLYADTNQSIRAADAVSFQGQTHLSIVEMPPIVTRGVLLDVAGCKGVEVLPDAYMISAADIQETMAKQGTDIRPGTAVLIRTGFFKHLREGNLVYRDAIAGIGLEAGQW